MSKEDARRAILRARAINEEHITAAVGTPGDSQ